MEYVVGETPAFAAMDYRVLPEDNIRCPHCGISFLELRKGEAVEGRGTVYWTRQWKGHCLHCKVPHKQKMVVNSTNISLLETRKWIGNPLMTHFSH